MNGKRRSLMWTGSVAAVFLIISGGPAFSGGLVDTSAERFAVDDFTGSQFITNPWWTLTAGDKFLYFAETEDGCAWNLVEVLGTTTFNFDPPYNGITARVVLDREWVDEDCIHDNFSDVWNDPDITLDEATYDWYAQDSQENIWYMGEDTLDAEGSREGSFVAGCDGAEAGIVVLGDPSKGDFYQQEFYEEEAEDWGKVLNFVELDDMLCMKTKEWTPLENGHIEHKFYCSDGVTGELVLVNELKGKTVVVEMIATGLEVGPVPPPPADPPGPNPTPGCTP